MNETLDRDRPSGRRCPVTGALPEPASGRPAVRPQTPLYTASQVEALPDPGPLGTVVRWMRDFLSQRHPEVGRPGPVCPFAPVALQLDTAWLTAVPVGGPDRETVLQLMTGYREVFLDLEPREGEAALNKAIVVVFPEIGREDAPHLIDEVQRELKPRFVEAGLMIGEFYETNDTPGLHNPDFRPLRSPIPMLAIRHMVESDLPFLTRDFDAPPRRSRFLRSYLQRLRGVISARHFELAVEALIRAELEQRGSALAGGPL